MFFYYQIYIKFIFSARVDSFDKNQYFLFLSKYPSNDNFIPEESLQSSLFNLKLGTKDCDKDINQFFKFLTIEEIQTIYEIDIQDLDRKKIDLDVFKRFIDQQKKVFEMLKHSEYLKEPSFLECSTYLGLAGSLYNIYKIKKKDNLAKEMTIRRSILYKIDYIKELIEVSDLPLHLKQTCDDFFDFIYEVVNFLLCDTFGKKIMYSPNFLKKVYSTQIRKIIAITSTINIYECIKKMVYMFIKNPEYLKYDTRLIKKELEILLIKTVKYKNVQNSILCNLQRINEILETCLIKKI